MRTALTISVQDYLKHIYELTEGGGQANTNALSERLHVTPASVTSMLQKLAAGRPPLVEYRKHQGAALTAAGRRAALEVIRHHRLIEAWLVQTLGYTWDQVHDEAERLEHVISEDFERRIAAAMGEPLRDPHGELIPTAALDMPPEHARPLSELRPGAKAAIRYVHQAGADLLRHLEELGLVPGALVEILEYSSFDHNLTVKTARGTRVLGHVVTDRVFVENSE